MRMHLKETRVESKDSKNLVSNGMRREGVNLLEMG
jgi:hypothetical protein